MKLIIAGGRNFVPTQRDRERIERLLTFGRVKQVISGGAMGADAWGETCAATHGIPVKRFMPDWRTHGKAAGPIRNCKMAEFADAIALFPGGRGTQSMLDEAVRAGLLIFDFR